MVDIHIHVIPDVDDGSDNMEDSLCMVRIAANQGFTSLIATPHSSAYDFGSQKVLEKYNSLRKTLSDQKIAVQVGLGCEILCYESDMDEIIPLLENGTYPTMNGTRYVLAEFFPNASRRAIIYCLGRLQEAGYYPIMAHAERYKYLDIETAKMLHGQGVLIQMNLYSVSEEGYERIRRRVRGLLENRLIDFAGSDGHSMSHRPPSYAKGVEYLYKTYDRAYVDDILQENAVRLLGA